jgi:predicted RNase H-like HicB family nuclease
MEVEIVFDREEDGRWIASIEWLPGVLAYGSTRAEAMARVRALAAEVLEEMSGRKTVV